jgi:hypothetical protein
MSPSPIPTPSPAPDHSLTRRHLLAASWAAGLGLAGCGGGSVDSVAADRDAVRRQGIDSGGTGSPMMSFMVAVVDSVSPLVAGGVHYDSGGTRWCDADDRPLTADDVAPGMTGWIDGTSITPTGLQAQATAVRVRIGEQVLGPVQAVDAAMARITVLGQAVVVTPRTAWGDGLGGGLAGLQAGRVLRVFGELDTAGGRIVATRVDRADGATAWVLRGLLSQLDRSSGQLVLGGVALQAGGAVSIPADAAPGVLLRVRVAAGTTRVLDLRSDALRLPDGVDVEIEGRITQVDTSLRFAVDGVWVDAAAVAPLAGVLPQPGLRAEVHGRAIDGVLVASRVTIEPAELIELEGRLQSVDLVARRLVLRGRTVRWSAATVFEGGSSALLVAGRKAAIKGWPSADGVSLQAQLIHVER